MPIWYNYLYAKGTTMEKFIEEKYNTLKSCFEQDLVFEMWPLNCKFTAEQLLYVISHKTYAMGRDLGIRGENISNTLDIFWPDRPKNSSNKVCKYILNSYGYKVCVECSGVKALVSYNKDNSNSDGLGDRCRDCSTQKSKDYRINNKEAAKESSRINYIKHKHAFIARAIEYKTHRNKATPTWADINKIKEMYDNCPKGYHVDHIVPLQGDLVSGLHVENNLQYLTAEDNSRKHNKYEI